MEDLKFVHVGMDHVVCANRILAILTPQTICASRFVKEAKSPEGRFHYIDATVGRKCRSVIVLDTGDVVTSCVYPRTLQERCMEMNLIPVHYKELEEMKEEKKRK